MPEMGESVSEGTVLEWLKAVGDTVEEGETVIEVSTDKVDAEVPAPASGTIAELLVEPDDVVAIGQVLGRIEPSGTAGGRRCIETDRRQRTAGGSPRSTTEMPRRRRSHGGPRRLKGWIFRRSPGRAPADES